MRLVDADVAPFYINDIGCKQIKNMPTIDVAPAVRCENCIYWVPPHIEMNDGTILMSEANQCVPLEVGLNVGSYCRRIGEDTPIWTAAEDFCSRGKLKDDHTEQDPHVVHGFWIPVDNKLDAFDCSECDSMVSNIMNYCPHCGAKMDGGINDV